MFNVLNKFLILCLLISKTVFAGPNKHKQYDLYNGATINSLPNNSILEGSASHGGIQPDYIIDREHPDIQAIIKVIKEATSKTEDFWKKVEIITHFVKTDVLPEGEYDNPRYRKLVKEYKEAGVDIPLSAFISCRAGVCRESAMITHILLDEIGIENFYLYVRVKTIADFFEPEDHALIGLKYKGEVWTVDSFNENFNGFLLEDLLAGGDDTLEQKKAPFAAEIHPYRKILKIHNYPKAWLPKGSRCSDMISDLLNM